MASHVALLRAVNVAGHNRIAMADLRELLTDMGLESVKTFLQSGNVVFKSSSRAGKRLERALQDQCADKFGLQTEFFVRSARQWKEVVEGNPFLREAQKTPDKVVVVFVKKPVSASAIRSLESAIKGKEYVAAARDHVYMVSPDGIGRSRLTAAIIEKALGSPITGRNWNTVLKLHAAVS